MICLSQRLFCTVTACVLVSACSSGVRRGDTPPPPNNERPQPTQPSPPASVSVPVPAQIPPQATAPASGTRPGGYYKDDGPGDNAPADLASVPDAVPKAEPLHRFANRPYVALGQSFTPRGEIGPYKERGIASWYGKRFHGNPTSSGEAYDMYAMTAAHPTLPIPSYARVTEVASGKSVVVRINDRGPFHKGRVIDLSYTAAWKLGYVTRGSAEVEVEALVPEGVDLVSGKKRVQPASIATVVVDADTALSAMPVEPVAPTAGQEAGSGIFLQLGSFSSSGNADSFSEFVRQEMKDVPQKLSVLSEGDRHRLHLGPFTTAQQARNVAAAIARKLKFTPFLVHR